MPDPTRMSEQQFVEAMEAARPVIVRRVTGRTNDPELADALAQNCLIDAWYVWMADPCYFVQTDLCGWATRRAYWRAKDHLQERARFARLADEHEATDGVKVPEGYAVAAEPQAERHQVWELVHECLAQLPTEERDVVDRHFFEGMTDQAIGEWLFGDDGRTRQARGLSVFRQRHAAMEQLRRLLVSRGYDPQTGLAP